MNMNCFSRFNVRKHIYINNGEKYTTLDILLKFVNMENMIITSLDPKDYLGRSGNGLITFLGLKINVRSNKNKK